MASGRRLQLAAVVLFFIAYSVLSHYSNLNPQAHDLRTVLALAPMLTLGLVLLWRWSGALMALLAAAAAAYLLRAFWPLFAQNFSIVYLLQQAGFYSIMAFTFGRSLHKGSIPLCTQIADKVHGPLSALELRYTRQVTLAWVIFFLGNVAANFLLFEFAPLSVWSVFVNFCSLPLILLMFAAEYAVRRRVLPQIQSSGLIATLRVYFADSPQK
ncbi:MAG TPA: hypothetical protein VK580_13245 [Steroidobacteraceae bacterium]|jgi:uncharacterized membrane protein|nr:hypothetical protein [Steroidobacteraceae bacterium]